MTKLSIITINYNNKTGLEKTMASVLGQSHTGFEYIVIDGGSIDGSLDVIKKYEDKINYWVSEKDGGIFNAQNKGSRKAGGDYLLVLNSGDVLENKNVIETFLPQLHSHQLIYGDLLTDDGNKQERLDMPDDLTVYYFMVSSLAHPCTFVSRDLYLSMQGYREDLKITSDFEFFLRAVLVMNASYRHIPGLVSVFNTAGISSDPANEEKHQQERKKSWELNFTPAVVKSFEEYTRVLRSGELKAGKLVKKILKPFKR